MEMTFFLFWGRLLKSWSYNSYRDAKACSSLEALEFLDRIEFLEFRVLFEPVFLLDLSLDLAFSLLIFLDFKVNLLILFLLEVKSYKISLYFNAYYWFLFKC